ncbi:hypothetical protein B5F74_10295 [Collinsella sp. An271]|nr:hypothetical protein B5F74_10295 [Collinsella sp. An271]
MLAERIDALYDMDRIWDSGGKGWSYELKWRRGGKTLCALYAKEDSIGFMVILGKAEREKFEALRGGFSPQIWAVYDAARTYHDGKWIMFEPTDESLFDDFMRLLAIKRRLNRKSR